MDSEDEFDIQLKRQRLITMDKENLNPNACVFQKSPLVEKLDEVLFNDSNFETIVSKKHFKSLVKETSDLLKIPIQPPGKRKTQVSPYQSFRVQREGMTMFEMMKATETPEKVVSFLQEKGCLPTRKVCPDCNHEMVLTERNDTMQKKIFRCKRRHGSTRCQRTISITAGTFFYGIHLSLFTVLWLLWGFAEGMPNFWFVCHLSLSSRTVTDWLNFCREVCMVCVEQKSRQIGGFGKIVEIDESKFVISQRQSKSVRRMGFGRYLQRDRGMFYANSPKQNKDNFAEIHQNVCERRISNHYRLLGSIQ